ncbi:hypothetical protein ES703_105699 [subsurface metagenome]
MVGRRPSSRTFTFRSSSFRGRWGWAGALAGSAWSIFSMSAALSSAPRTVNGATATADRIRYGISHTGYPLRSSWYKM